MKVCKDKLTIGIWSLLIMFMGTFLFTISIYAAQKNEIKIGNYMDVGTLDPGWMSSMFRDYVVMDCIFDGLAKYEEGSWKVVPDLAESWDVSEDNLEITFHLHKGVQFHKGYGEMTAEDVKFSYDRLLAPDSKAPEKDQVKFIDHVDVLDKYTAKMVLKRPAAQLFTLTLPTHTGFIISKKACEEIGQDEFSRNPVGCGPYEFESWKPKSQLVLKAFKNYWRGKPKVERVVFVPIPDERTRIVGLKTGEIDVAYTTLNSIKSVRKDPNIEVSVSTPLKWRWIGFTQSKPPFDNVKLRKAVRYAVNVDDIIHAVYFDEAKRIGAVLPEGTLGYWKDAPLYQQDLAKARQLLKEGGMPNGFKATINVANLDIAQTNAEIIKNQLAKVGIELIIDINEIGAFNDGLLSAKYDMFVERWSNNIDPARILQFFCTGNKWNIVHWDNKEYNELVKKASSEMDPKKRADIYIRIQQIMDEECFAIFITRGVTAWSFRKNVVSIGKQYPNGRLTPWTMSFK
jgi:peptide/nickel transport system substrate-binding protein